MERIFHRGDAEARRRVRNQPTLRLVGRRVGHSKPDVLGILLSGWLREPLAVAFFDAAQGPEQMAICACPKLLGLPVEGLHHQRIENADLLQQRHIAMDASEGCVETAQKIVDEGFWYAAGRFRCAVRIGVSHRPPFLEGDLWSGTVRALTGASPVFFV